MGGRAGKKKGQKMKYSDELERAISLTYDLAIDLGHRYLVTEHFLLAIAKWVPFRKMFSKHGGNVERLAGQLEKYLRENIPPLEEGKELEITDEFESVFQIAELQASSSGRKKVDVCHVLAAILALEDNYGAFFLAAQKIDLMDLIGDMSRESLKRESGRKKTPKKKQKSEEEEKKGTRYFYETGMEDEDEEKEWRDYVLCLNDIVMNKNPLIGREEELERTIQVLCRMEKNNVLHIGEPGVGKTAIVYGLARRIVEGEVPKQLRTAVIYSLEMGTLLAGTQYRGEFEKRLKVILEGLSEEENPIVYLDEIHNIVGAGATNGGSFDASNMLKPYLAEGKIRFIGSTTYEEYKKHFEGSKGLVRRFIRIDIKEPTREEAIQILKGLRPRYEKFHGVTYPEEVLSYAVQMSARYINERFLPDKAIDLMDEAGAFRKLHPLKQKKQEVTNPLIEEILTKTYQIPKQSLEAEDLEKLKDLEGKLKQQIFGQDEALEMIANVVQFSKAGLNEEQKPIASFLFLGSTGVGKTESARVLAKELGISLIRFDMSEYGEKHAAAKLIGSPAGYVGYEEGGLLTEEIRKHPHCVLLLDEMEKAHPDVFNILLQVMDYATLTDNQGRKADFRNVILVMTSNAGAESVGKEMIGFDRGRMDQSAMEEAAKRLFKPEFRNRLSKMVVFHSMDEKMAMRITEKKLSELSKKCENKKIALIVEESAKKYLMEKGITREYGAREIDRVIESEVKPLLAKEILFGRLKHGGDCRLKMEKKEMILDIIE